MKARQLGAPYFSSRPSPSRLPSSRTSVAISHRIFSRGLCSRNPVSDQEVDTVFSIVVNSSPDTDLKKTLNDSGVFISNDLIDRVLKRIRFSHGNPLRALDFFNITGRRRGFYHTSLSLDTILYILGRGRKFSLMWDTLYGIRRKDRSLISPRTVHVVLGRVAKICSVRETLISFRKFRRVIQDFDTHCFNALLRALCQEKSMKDAKSVYHLLKREFKPNLLTFNTLLSGWKSCEEAEGFFEDMEDMGLSPDIVSYNSLLDVYCKAREMGKANGTLMRMREKGITPNTISYTCIIGGLGLMGQPEKGREMLKEMREYGCYPDVPAYNASIRNFCIAKRMGEAYDLMNVMEREGLCANPTTYNLFFRVFHWSNDLKSSWEMYRLMMGRGCVPNTQSCMFLMRMFRRHENVEMALELWNDMVEKNFGSYTLASDVLLGFLCDLGKVLEAEKCFLEMVEKGHRPSSVSFRRIKVLMELASMESSLEKLTAKMAVFNTTVPSDEEKKPTSGIPLHQRFTTVSSP